MYSKLSHQDYWYREEKESVIIEQENSIIYGLIEGLRKWKGS